MKILIDADACPVTNIAINIGKKYNIPVILVMDTSHWIMDDYAESIIVDKERDSADFAILNKTNSGDIVITQDYGLASMILAKNAYAINQNGMNYTDDNIDRFLMERHINKKARDAGQRIRGMRKRETEDDENFKYRFEKLINSILNENNNN